MDKVLVTGADGFLGNNVTRRLIKLGFQVKAFLQPGRNTNSLDGLSIEKYTGDLLNQADLLTASSDCDYIIHTAANTSIWPSRSEIVRRVNIEGTGNVIKAAAQDHIKRLVYVGTASSFGFGTRQIPGTESSPFKSDKYGLDYIDSKKQAQDNVLEAVQTLGLKAIIVNPTFMIGAYDTKPSSGTLLLALYQGKVPGYTNSGRNFLHVKDAAVAIVNALIQGRVGECYILGNENLTYKEFYKIVGSELHISPPGILIPKPFILMFGWFSQVIAKITGNPATVSLPVARVSLDSHFFSAKKAIEELDLPQTPISIAIKDAFEWFKTNNYLNKKV